MTTNYEKIKNMNIEEMGEFLDNMVNNCCESCSFRGTGCEAEYCVQGKINWLESETE